MKLEFSEIISVQGIISEKVRKKETTKHFHNVFKYIHIYVVYWYMYMDNNWLEMHILTGLQIIAKYLDLAANFDFISCSLRLFVKMKELFFQLLMLYLHL